MLDCFINFVGLIRCGAYSEPSESGQYINTLPGLTLDQFNKIAESEQRNYTGVWADIQAEASARFYTDILQEILTCFKLNKNIDYEDLICFNKKVFVNAWKYLLGKQFMTERLYSSRVNKYTTVDRAQAEKLEVKFDEEYLLYLRQAVTLMDVSKYEEKLCCGGNPEVRTWLP
jgi:hypothetical protein